MLFRSRSSEPSPPTRATSSSSERSTGVCRHRRRHYGGEQVRSPRLTRGSEDHPCLGLFTNWAYLHLKKEKTGPILTQHTHPGGVIGNEEIKKVLGGSMDMR